jgi:hypothetical protein
MTIEDELSPLVLRDDATTPERPMLRSRRVPLTNSTPEPSPPSATDTVSVSQYGVVAEPSMAPPPLDTPTQFNRQPARGFVPVRTQAPMVNSTSASSRDIANAGSTPSPTADMLIALLGPPVIAAWQRREDFDAIFQTILADAKPTNFIEGLLAYEQAFAVWETQMLRCAKSAVLRKSRQKVLKAYDEMARATTNTTPSPFSLSNLEEIDQRVRDERLNAGLPSIDAMSERVERAGISQTIINEDTIFEALPTLQRISDMEAQYAARVRGSQKLLKTLREGPARRLDVKLIVQEG